ncbi:MAG: PKD domain-containing protein [Candidatus Electrothrix sp. AUS1_2]|nr:PKD domain-containing protein [Candidatus Electrothrix sp. AUS1_2]
MTQPQTVETIKAKNQIYLKGISTNLRLNDPLLIDFGDDNPQLRWVKEIRPDAENNRTLVLLKRSEDSSQGITYRLDVNMLSSLVYPPSHPPASPRRLRRDTANAFGLERFHSKLSEVGAAETSQSILRACNLKLKDTLVSALSQAKVAPKNPVRVYALRKKAAPFGHNAPLKPIGMDQNKVMLYDEWEINKPISEAPDPIASFVVKNINSSNGVYTVSPGERVVFKNTSRGVIEKVTWNFGEGEPVVVYDLSDRIHTYSQTRNYEVKLTIEGHNGKKDEVSITIEVSTPPIK